MSEIRRPRPQDTFIWPSSVWAEAFSAMLREITVMRGHEVGTGVLGGFAWSNPEGLTTVIGPGAAIALGTASPPIPDYKFVYNEVEITADHDEPDDDHRIDTVSISWSIVADTPHVLGRVGNALPASTNTQSGCVCEVVITKGTPTAGTPVAPAPASGHIKLYEVYVAPSGDLTVIDKRLYAAHRSRRSDRSLISVVPNTETKTDLFDIKVMPTGAGDMSVESQAAWTSYFRWSLGEDWPYFVRNGPVPGAGGQSYYPMAVPAGRTWWRTLPWAGRDYIIGAFTAIHGLTYLTVARTDPSATFQQVVPIPSDSRGIEVVAAKVRYQCMTVFDGSQTDKFVKIYKVAADGTQSEIATEDLVLGSTHGSVQELSLTMTTTPVLAEGEQLFAAVSIVTVGGGGSGLLRLYSVAVQFKEGIA